MDVLIKNAVIATQDEDRRVVRGSVGVEDGRVVAVGDVRGEAEFVLEGRHLVVTPGLVNMHTHVAMSVFRGLVDDVALDEFLRKTFALDAERREEDLFAGALLGIAEMLLSGTTAFMDLYYSEDVIARAVERAGIRGVLAWAVLDEEHTTQSGVPVKNAERFAMEHRSELVTPAIGFQGVYVCSEETLLKGKEVAERLDIPMHMHLSETRKEVYGHHERYGNRPVEWLKDIDLLCPRLSAAHAVWLTLREIRMLGEAGVTAVNCPVSNMKLGTGGSSPLPEMMAHGVNITLGTDSAASNNALNLLETMKVAALLQKNERWDASILTAQDVLDFATTNAYRYLGLEGGVIGEGAVADLVVWDLSSPFTVPYTSATVVSDLVYSAGRENVRDVIVGGKPVVLNRRVQTFSVEDVLEKAMEIMKNCGGEV